MEPGLKINNESIFCAVAGNDEHGPDLLVRGAQGGHGLALPGGPAQPRPGQGQVVRVQLHVRQH